MQRTLSHFNERDSLIACNLQQLSELVYTSCNLSFISQLIIAIEFTLNHDEGNRKQYSYHWNKSNKTYSLK